MLYFGIFRIQNYLKCLIHRIYIMVENLDSEDKQTACICILISPFSSCVTLSKLLNLWVFLPSSVK